MIGELALVAGAFLAGAIPFGVLLARRRGVDIRAHGSGNIGATNVTRVLGPRTGAVVLVLDALKGALPTAAALAVDAEPRLVALTGGAAILGHCFSPFLRGRGGKGVATAAGAVAGSHPMWLPFVLLAWLLVVGVSRWVALASVVASVVVLVVALATRAPFADVAWAAAIAAIVLFRHRSNFSTDRRRARREGSAPT